MERINAAIATGEFDAFGRDYLARYRTVDEDVRSDQKDRYRAQAFPFHSGPRP